jgi:hypothetical protein
METIIEKFWNYVVKGEPNDCWEWKGCKCQGYGQLRDYSSENKNGKYFSHRFSYQLHHPLIKSIHDIDLCVCHSCDNRGCVNPAHLRLDTRTNNNKERMEKNRSYRPVGERNPTCILNEKQVKEIRSEYQAGNITQVELAKEYGVKPTVIWEIVNRRSWRHI